MTDDSVLALILAGGKGSRLDDLTEHRVKPALPFAGTYRLIDIALSNLAHSGIRDVWIVEQYLPHTLNDHLAAGRPWDLDRSHGGLQVMAPFEGGPGEGFASGNTDSLARQLAQIERVGPDLVLVVSSDHAYTLDYRDVIATHRRTGADLTMVTAQIDERCTRYGVVSVDGDRVTGFDYKPDEPPGNRVACEVFLFDRAALADALRELAERTELGDYGDDLVPWFVEHRRVAHHDLGGYWMDLGTLQSYWTAHLQLLDGTGIRLDRAEWPIWSAQPQLLPARVEDGAAVHDSLLSAGSTVRGTVRDSVIGPGVVVEEGATVHRSVVLDGARVGPGVHLENTVVAIGADVSGGAGRGSATTVTLIGHDGLVSTREDLDPHERLPAGVRAAATTS